MDTLVAETSACFTVRLHRPSTSTNVSPTNTSGGIHSGLPSHLPVGIVWLTPQSLLTPPPMCIEREPLDLVWVIGVCIPILPAQHVDLRLDLRNLLRGCVRPTLAPSAKILLLASFSRVLFPGIDRSSVRTLRTRLNPHLQKEYQIVELQGEMGTAGTCHQGEPPPKWKVCCAVPAALVGPLGRISSLAVPPPQTAAPAPTHRGLHRLEPCGAPHADRWPLPDFAVGFGSFAPRPPLTESGWIAARVSTASSAFRRECRQALLLAVIADDPEPPPLPHTSVHPCQENL